MKKLTSLSLVIVAVFCLATFAIGFVAVAKVSGEDPLAVFRSTPKTVVEVWFPDDSMGHLAAGEATIRLGVIVGSERAVAVVCPSGFEPDLALGYIVEPHRLEMVDGRITPTVWVLRPTEFHPPKPATPGQLILQK